MTARLIGELVEREGCLQVIDENQNVFTLAWPPETQMTLENRQVRVLLGLVSGNQQEVILRVGEMILVGGGISEQLDEYLQGTIPSNCQGPYWVVGTTIAPHEPTEQP
jgi:hypothetical protein